MARIRGLVGVAAAVTILLAACRAIDSPTTPGTLGSPGVAVSAAGNAVSSDLPSWVINPETLPPGRVGRNNCTFAFGQTVPQWDFHPDAGCWEHDGPDGWTRQQQQRIHIPNFPACGGGPGDANTIRVCRPGGAGQITPCNGERTGPNGCARCVINPTCH